ncbi:MAG: protoporphyrinogen oxidase [Verrucomicrobiota bacterium]
MITKDVIIIGGGLSGLSTALQLKAKGASILVLDQRDTPGGVVESVIRDGYLAEKGPNTLLVNDRRVEDLIQKVGLASSIVEPSPEARKRFLVKNGKLIPAPMSPFQFLGTPLFSFLEKLRLLLEPFVLKYSDNQEESLAAFIKRRLGRGFFEQAFQPLVSGIYAGDPDRLSVKYAFPVLYRFEQDQGSLFKGGLYSIRNPAPHRIKRKMISFLRGMEQLPQAMAESLGEVLQNCCQVKSLSQHSGGGWQVTWTNDGVSKQANAKHLVVTIPAFQLVGLVGPPAMEHVFQELAEIPYSPISLISLGFKKSQVAHPLDGFGMLIPERESFEILGTVFPSSLFEGRAPIGSVLLTSFIGGRMHPEAASFEDELLIERTCQALRRLLGIKGSPEFIEVVRWPRAIPQMEVGHHRYLQRIEALEDDFKGIHLAGSYRYGISAPQCLISGIELGDKIAQCLGFVEYKGV